VLLLPAAFPALLVFGGMGWINATLKSLDAGNMLIDIGTVMAPSVALGVTVDDVVHFMLWFRRGIADGLDRKQAVMLAYKGCARAMYQSWGVIGIGLSVFSLSPFGPTQRFGYMMLSMLTIALVGNLVLMPALLSGPLGAVFGWSVQRIERKKAERENRRRLKTDPGSDALPPPHVVPGQAKQVVHA
jgi:predicted RND superfamily exporter protein